MLVRTSYDRMVSIVGTDKKSLFDADGGEWERTGTDDVPGFAAYKLCNTTEFLLLHREELVRVCFGEGALLTPTNLAEMREYISRLPQYEREVAERWPEGRLAELLPKDNKTPADFRRFDDTILALVEQELKPEEPTEAPEKPPEAPPAPKPTKRPPRGKKQPGGFEGAFEGKRVLLTPKQVEFMERLDELECWDPQGQYFADVYADCLADTLSPMAVGAVVTTLREKGVIVTESMRDHGRKACAFSLTELGRWVYDELVGGRV